MNDIETIKETVFKDWIAPGTPEETIIEIFQKRTGLRYDPEEYEIIYEDPIKDFNEDGMNGAVPYRVVRYKLLERILEKSEKPEKVKKVNQNTVNLKRKKEEKGIELDLER